MEDLEEKLIRPIRNASSTATLASLSLAGAKLILASSPAYTLFLLAAMTFLVSSFSIFFYSLYPTKRLLWTVAAIAFLVGLCCLISSVFVLFVI